MSHSIRCGSSSPSCLTQERFAPNLRAHRTQLIQVGNVFEKRLIEHYIQENSTDPVTNEELTIDDLVELKSSRTVAPRPPTLTSIPSLLSTFQNEWDAIVLESFKLRQSLAQTRQELSTALYENDAAARVIARVSRERDQAREALSKITLNGGATTNGEAMQVDVPEIPEALLAKVGATQKKYVNGYRTIPPWALIPPSDFQALARNAQCQRTGLPAIQSKHSSQLKGPKPRIPELRPFLWIQAATWF